MKTACRVVMLSLIVVFIVVTTVSCFLEDLFNDLFNDFEPEAPVIQSFSIRT